MRIPWWVMALDPNDWGEMNQIFRDFMSSLPLSQNELADELGVDASKVSRWGSGKTTPPPWELRALVNVVKNRLAAIQTHVDSMDELVEALDGIDAAWTVKGMAAIKRSSAARNRVHELLRKRSRKRPKTTKRRRRKR